MIHLYAKDILRKYKVFFLTIMSLMLALVLTCIDASMAGLMQRYTADVALMVMWPACMIVVVLMDHLATNRGRNYYILSRIIMMAVLLTAIFDFCLLFNHMRDANEEVYYLVASYFRI